MQKFDKLNFITAGMPKATDKGSYPKAIDVLVDLGLDGLEIEFVHGVRMSDETRAFLNKNSNEKNLILTAHAPFYVNLNSQEVDKVDASVRRIVETAQVAKQAGAFSITYHAAYYMKQEKELVYQKVKQENERIFTILDEEKNDLWIRPETTGKATQWGDLDEIIRLSNDFERVLPCVDFSHLHARTNGEHNTYDEFCIILEKIGKEIGTYALENFHGHLAGIEYGAKGEKKHLNMLDSDMNYKDLLKAMKEFDVKGVLTCESPNIEEDCLLYKNYYNSL
ncbi:MAG: TIM barrel protein [Candidatus Gastranaerophilales bacterium]